MVNNGLVSVTFRKVEAEEVVRLAKQAGLGLIEWGSDVHAPETDLQRVEYIRRITEESKLSVSSYGTYYKLGKGQDFKAYLYAAEILKAPIMRIWAGEKGSSVVTEKERADMVAEAKNICRMAAQKGIRVDFEYHPNTLTDNKESAALLMQEIQERNCGLYWQPDFKKTLEENLAAIRMVAPFIDIVHVFFWDQDARRRHLAEGQTIWKKFMREMPKARNIAFLLEFLPQDNGVYLPYEAGALRNIEEAYHESGICK